MGRPNSKVSDVLQSLVFPALGTKSQVLERHADSVNGEDGSRIAAQKGLEAQARPHGRLDRGEKEGERQLVLV